MRHLIRRVKRHIKRRLYRTQNTIWDRYKYVSLDPSSNDIRLVTILPGKFKDPIWIKITRAPLVPPIHESGPKRLSLKEIRNSLPKDWNAHETFEGRIVFWNDEEDCSSWSHPDPTFPRDAYDPQGTGGGQSQMKYEALSYVWGPKDRPETAIVCSNNIQDRERIIGYLPIRRNLAEAIRHLRHSSDDRIMWIDAICINQNDVGERDKQVKRMSQIYSLAHRVVAWLGPSSDNSALAISRLTYLGQQVESTRDNYTMSSPNCDQPKWYDAGCELPYGIDDWEAISKISSRELFKRLWVVQEIHLGSARAVIQCGNDEIPWSLFRRAMICIDNKFEGTPEDMLGKMLETMDFCHYIDNETFDAILHRFQGRLCIDDRDRIYGLMSLASSEVTRGITPNYEQSPVEVYKHTFLACTQQAQRLVQLPFCGRHHAPDTLPEWPTWIPNWSQPIQVSVPLYSGYYASSISASRVRYVDPSQLEVTSLCFGTVSRVDEQIAASNLSAFLKTCQRVEFDQSQDSRYHTSKTNQDVWLWTITIGRLRDRFPDLTGLLTIAELSEAVIKAQSNEAVAESRLSDWFKQNVPPWISGSYPFRLRSGHIGVIRGMPQEGDKVFVIPGCAVPMLLRPTLRGEYQVIGDCYVHGIMDGEAFLGSIPPSWSVVMEPGRGLAYIPHYYNKDTDHTSAEDPRLEQTPIPPEWEPIDWEWTRSDPIICAKFRNKETGEVINSDPRLSHEALIARGIPLKTITLV
ncbi:HET-domain-containing protein [Hypomontagnella monticulosa]|nr:HET-domain-containing protein [Hypomontagnella monticulosa]